MRTLFAVWLILVSAPLLATADPRVYMIGKVKIVETTHTQVVLFHDKGITNMADCQREIQRGVRGQWRFHHHTFAKPRGFMQRVDYYCVTSELIADPWYTQATYDFVYKVDLRSQALRITPQNSYSDCLHSVRREVADETSRFFCAKLSQTLRL